MEKELREELKILKIMVPENQKNIISLAESYLALKDCPKEIVYSEDGHFVSGDYERGYNRALKDCKLALLKKMDGITPEFLHNEYLKTVKHLHPESYNPVANKPYAELTDEQKSIDMFIAQAIKDHLTK